MSRTPLIAGNWKMHGTIAEAEERVAALLPRCRALEPRRARASACRSPRCRPSSTRRAARALEVYAQNMHYAPEGAFTGEISRADAHRARRPRRRARPLRAPRTSSARPTRRCSSRCPRRWTAGLEVDPLRRRDRGGARERRHRAPAAPPGPGGPGEGRRPSASATSSSPTSRSGRSAPARSPRPSRPRTRWRSSARWSPTAPRSRPSARGSSTAAR